MRTRLIGTLVASAAMITSAVLVAGNATADIDLWNVSTTAADNSFDGTAGTTNLTLDNGIPLSCESSSAHGNLNLGPSVPNPIAVITELPGIVFNNCTGPIGLTFSVTQVGDWTLNAHNYDAATDTVSGTIDGIDADIEGPGCEATASGSVNVTYANATDVLTVLPDFTLTISFVDPANNCFGLVTQGQTASFDGTYQVAQDLTVVPA